MQSRITVRTLAWACCMLFVVSGVVVIGRATGQEAAKKAPAATPPATNGLDSAPVVAGENSADPAAGEAPVGDTTAEDQPTATSKTPAGLIRLAKDYDLWIDPKRKLVVIDGRICLREGQLEMFACPKGTKEHESVIALNSKAQFVHAALLAVGAEPGRTVRFNPEYVPAAGPEVDVFVLWKDRDGNKRQVRAQEWVRHVPTKKAMELPWVFAGSGFWTDEQTGERFYNADAGELICVSNFTTATMDLPVKSSQANADLLFEAFTERIPSIGTQVRVVLRPKLPGKPAGKPEGAPAGKPAANPAVPPAADPGVQPAVPPADAP
jgi:hypothetical protein